MRCGKCRRSGNDFQSIFLKSCCVSCWIFQLENNEHKKKKLKVINKKKESLLHWGDVCPAWRITAESRATACGVYRNTKDEQRSCLVSLPLSEQKINGEKKVHPRIFHHHRMSLHNSNINLHFKSITIKMLIPLFHSSLNCIWKCEEPNNKSQP